MSVYDIDYFKMFRYNAIRKIRGENMALSESRKKANKKYDDSHYKKIMLRLKNDDSELLEQFVKQHDLTKNGFIRKAIAYCIENEIY